MKKSTAILLGATMALSGISACRASAPASTMTPVPTRYGVFSEALVPFGTSAPAESAALRRAISRYRAGGNAAQTRPLDRFLKRHPDSVWRIALLTNEGLAYAHAGKFSLALNRLEAAWDAGRSARGQRQRALVDKALAQLLRLHAAFGHAAKVDDLLHSIRGRTLSGPARVARTVARDELWNMRHKPGTTFICGLIALKNLLALQPGRQDFDWLVDVEAPSGGMALSKLAALFAKAELPARMIFRKENQPIPVPSIVHWKVGHFATVVARRGEQFLVKDAVMGRDLWMTRDAINSESSGYFLTGEVGEWRAVAPTEGRHVVGAGITSGNNPDATSNDDVDVCGCGGGSSSSGMARYSVKAMLVSLSIHDTPVGYTPPKGPAVPVTLVYSQREANQPANFTYFNLGHKWTSNWLSFVRDNPSNPGSRVMVYLPGGGARHYGGYDRETGAFAPENRSGARLVEVSRDPVVYERRMPDGSKYVYSASDGSVYYPRRVFLTEVVDTAGNSVRLTYDDQMRLVALTDALNQSTAFQYDNAAYPLRITGVTDPFGRHAEIRYDDRGRLIGITDVIGMQSLFKYDDGTFIRSMSTPYGTTRFAAGQSGTTRWLEITDPQGHMERVEYRHSAPGIGFSTSPVPAGIRTFNAYINSRNTFFWDETAMERAPGDYSKARIYHWLHEEGRVYRGLTAGVLESVKQPLERRVWFNYPDQPWAGGTGGFDKPSAIARVLDDGTTQLTRLQYNRRGRATLVVDPVGRQTRYVYGPNGMDLIQVKRKTGTGFDILAAWTYNEQHEPLTYTDAAGQISRYSYNDAGQLTLRTDPLGNTTRYVYDGDGYLLQIIDANGKTYRGFTYDRFGRVASVTDSEGRTLHYEYDALNRLTRVSYPDGTDQRVVWDKLDPVSYTDREGRTTALTYNSVRNLVSRTNPLGQTTKFRYYANGKIEALIDPNGNATKWLRDIEGRVTARVYADGSKETYSYDRAGRLESKTDPLGQVTRFTYAHADRLSGVSYANALYPTPSVHFDYGRYYPRLVEMTDGHGATRYSYYPAGELGAGKLKVAQGENPRDRIEYTYDALGRLASRAVDGARETYSYDVLGRLVGVSNLLGSFATAYLGETNRPISRTIAGVPYRVRYQYEDNLGDRRLKAILNETLVHHRWQPVINYRFTTSSSGLILSRAGEAAAHGHDNQGRHRGWKQGRHRGWDHAPHWGVLKWLNGTRGGMADTLEYTYDQALRLTEVTGEAARSYSYDSAGNLTRVADATNTAQISVNELNQIEAVGSASYRYDANGNLIDDGVRAYMWDAANRLIAIHKAATGHTSRFVYDGFSRRISATEVDSGAEPVTVHFLWCGQRICEQRTADGMVAARYYRQGEVHQGERYYYAQDQVGSVVALVGSAASVVGRLNYDAFGNIVSSSGILPDFRYAGLFYHAPSGLELATYRSYDSGTGRWLSRDPIREAGGFNLYRYVANNPITNIDPSGLARFGIRPLDALGFIPVGTGNPLDDSMNTELIHEQLWFDDGLSPSNIGFFSGPKGLFNEPGELRSDAGHTRSEYIFRGPIYDDAIMRQALSNIRLHWINGEYNLLTENCQHFADALRREYFRLGGEVTYGLQ